MPRRPSRSRAGKQRVENAAANVVRVQLGSDLSQSLTACQWDDGSADGMHDFYVTGDGVRVALEITTLADGDRVGRNVRWKREAPRHSVTVAGLDGVWMVDNDSDEAIEASAVVEALRAQMLSLSRSDVPDRVDTRRWYEHVHSTPEVQRAQGTRELQALHAVGITQVWRVADASAELLAELLAEHNGEVLVMRGFSTVRQPDPDHPVRLIDEHLAGPYSGDVTKLQRASDATARHLWLWLTFEDGLPLRASFESEGLPGADPSTAGIDGLWLAPEQQGAQISGWYWVRGQGWGEFSCERDEDVPLC